jgi:UDP-N-acetylmuramoylalanine--D-glutamate ligase
VAGFDSVVLIAGGFNDKRVRLTALSEVASHVRAVVAIGLAASEVAEAFGSRCRVTFADTMREAVLCAHQLARRGDTVLLSPALPGRDWYIEPYRLRGQDFCHTVREVVPGFQAEDRALEPDVDFLY